MARRHAVAIAIKQHSGEHARPAISCARVSLDGVVSKLRLDRIPKRLIAIHCRAGEPAVIITRPQAHPALVALTVEASQDLALRLQRIEFLLDPLPGRFAARRSHSGSFRSAVYRCWRTLSSASLGADQSTG